MVFLLIQESLYLYNEILIMREQDILYRIKATVMEFDKNARVVLFGSRATKESRSDSDWDLLILTSFPIDE